MLTLANAELSVDLLDPTDPADRAHQGIRFCWGGYIWQVQDPRGGPLLAGPEWPHPTPKAFNGQGLPESFRYAEFGTQRPLMLRDGLGWIIGIGRVAPGPDGKPVVTEPCSWRITPTATALEFRTDQSGDGYGTELTRRVALEGRTLVSTTSLTNTGARVLPLHWFAHPFFALTDRLLTCELPAGYSFPENPGYALDARNRLSFKRRFENELDGHFEPLRIAPGQPLRVQLSHPHLSGLTFSADFTPDFCPIWGNSNTWSIEPYLVTELAPGATRTWTLRYTFGSVRN